MKSVLVAVLVCWIGSPAVAEVKVGQKAPELTALVDESGKPATPPGYAGQVMVISFGASWCEPCKKELPALDKVAVGFAKRKSAVSFIAINIDNELEAGKKFARDLELKQIRVLFDRDKKMAEAFDPPKMPTLYIITNGKVAQIQGGYGKNDADEWHRMINVELAKLK